MIDAAGVIDLVRNSPTGYSSSATAVIPSSEVVLYPGTLPDCNGSLAHPTEPLSPFNMVSAMAHITDAPAKAMDAPSQPASSADTSAVDGDGINRDAAAEKLVEHDLTAHPIIFFDGVCGLCSKTVRSITRRDPDRVFRFAPLQGEVAAALLPPADRERLDSLVLLNNKGRYRESSAVVRILNRLGGGYRIPGALLWLIPKPLRDLGYKLVSKYRYHLWGTADYCEMPKAGDEVRYLE